MALKEVALTESLPSPYLDRYEPTKGQKDVVFICSPKKWTVDIHYSDKLKTSFQCFDGLCCKVFPKKTSYNIYLIAQYTDRKNPKSALTLKYLRAGRQLDEAIRAVAEQFEDPSQITKLDLTFALDTTKGEKFKQISVTPCVDGQRRASKEALLDLKNQIKTFLPSLSNSIAQEITEEQFIEMCEEKEIDLSEFTEDQPVRPKKKVVKEEVEEPEEIDEDDIPFNGEKGSLGSDVEDEEDYEFVEEEEEVEEKPSKKSTSIKKSNKKVEESVDTEVDDTNFDLDSLL